VDVDVRDILTEPPGRDILGRIARVTPGGAREMVTPRTDSAEYREHIAGKELGEDQLLDILAKTPNLLRKPLLTEGNRALQGVDDPARLRSFVEAKT
jgi:arsenate reductase-like glutaredoxin family protein